MALCPSDLKYAETHEWCRPEGDVVTVGITDYAVKELTDLTYLELPKVGDVFDAGASFGVIESVKATSDLVAPVSGTVVQVNGSLPQDLDALAKDPYGNGWMIKLRPSHLAADLARLLSAEAYQKGLEGK